MDDGGKHLRFFHVTSLTDESGCRDVLLTLAGPRGVAPGSPHSIVVLHMKTR